MVLTFSGGFRQRYSAALRRRKEILTRRSVKRVGNGHLARGKQNLAVLPVDRQIDNLAFVSPVEIPLVVFQMLEVPDLARPFIIGPHGKLGFLEGGALEEEIYRRTDRAGIGGSGSWASGTGRVPQAQCFGAVVLSLESQVRWHGRLGELLSNLVFNKLIQAAT